jgi:hypothetical protein
MIFFVLLIALIALAAALIFVIGAAGFAAIPIVVVLGIGLWMAWTFVSGRSPGPVVRRSKQADLLGPGGPDDPDRTANRGTENLRPGTPA